MLYGIVARFGLRGTGYKKGLFPINNSQHATRIWLAINVVVGLICAELRRYEFIF